MFVNKFEMADLNVTYAETAAHFELIAMQLEDRNAQKNQNVCTEKLESCWMKLQTLVDIDGCKNRKGMLIQTQKMIKLLCDQLASRSRSDSKSENSSAGDNLRSASIEQTILQPGKIAFDEIAGLDEAKTVLREAIVLPLQYPHLFEGKRKPWKSILLYGPPGTGKSRMAEAVSSEIESTFYSVSSADLLSSWFGESEKLIKELFEHARNRENKAIVFIDEIDSLCRKRDSKEAETTRRIKTELLKQMQGANTASNDINVFFLCATNCPWELDTAFLRRFEKRIYIPLPDRVARKQLFDIHLGDIEVHLDESDWQRLLERTEGYSGSDIATCISDALLEPIRDITKSTHWKWCDKKISLRPCDEKDPDAIALRLQNIPKEKVQPRALLCNDIMKALSLNQRTVSFEEMERYDEFTKSFGQIG